MIALKFIETPLGKMIAGANNDGLCLFDFQYRNCIESIKKRIAEYNNDTFIESDHYLFHDLEAQFLGYLGGERKEFELPLQLAGTPFQITTWNILREIPYGQTITYNKLASLTGFPDAVRAAASANGANGLAIIIPCHRVTGKYGALTGYSGGLRIKKWLLEHEQKHVNTLWQLK